MIDQAALKRDAQANISDWPTQARFRGKPLTVGLSSAQDAELLMAGGILDDRTFVITAIADDIGEPVPRKYEKFQILLSNGSWLNCEIAGAPDKFDPLGVTVTILLQSPHK
jgi:hypothetical protein